MPYDGTQAGIGLGTVLSIGDTASPIGYTDVGELSELDESGRQAGTDDATNFQSTAREFLPTLIDSGTWAFTGNRVGGDDGQVEMETAFAALSVRPFKIQLPKTAAQAVSGDTATFKALIEQLNYTIGMDKIVKVQGQLKVSGIITWTLGS
jgi:hypothetical protein